MREHKLLNFTSLLSAAILCLGAAQADIIVLKDGGEKIDGKIIEESDTHITVKLKTGGKSTFPKAWIKDIKKAEVPEEELYTKQDVYLSKLKTLDPKDAEAQMRIAKWCFDNATEDNGLFEMADRHYKAARDIDPKYAEKVGKELAVAQEKEAGKLFSVAETEYKWGEYSKAEQMAVSVISLYPDTSFAGKARGLINKIWGNARAPRIFDNPQNLPEVVFTVEEMQSVLSHMGTEERKQAYFMKCLDRGIDYEERAEEVDKDKRGGYYMAAIACYDIVSGSAAGPVKKSADFKMQGALKKYFDSKPEPFSDARYALMAGYILKIQDPPYIEKLTAQYSKMGDELFKKAKRMKQPEKAEKAKTAYFCFSIVNNYSKDEKIKQDAFEKMIECQRMERASK